MSGLDALGADWPHISELLDEVLSLPAGDRAAWLDGLDGERATFRERLRQLLDASAHVESDFLNVLPQLRCLPAADGAVAAADIGGIVGPYRLLSELGRGGMGTVWLAERVDGQLKRRVALKLPRLAWGGALAERLARERDILASLAHPNIARLYDAGVDAQGRPYLAMEVVEGEPIDVYCRERALPVRAQLGLLLQVAAAVAHAHSRLVVHRDLKPGNILVTADGQVRLLDFGIAKLMEGELTAETALTQHAGRALTLDYASPEQIRGEPLGTASDVYSLAVVAYEVLAGIRPYRLKRGSAAELEEAIASVDPPLASEMATEPAARKALRGDLDAVLNKALKKDAAQRYAGVEALARDIERHLQGLPVQARPDGRRYRLKKFLLRHRLAVSAGAGIALALLAGIGVSLWQASLARQQAANAHGEAAARAVVSEFMFSSFARIAGDPAVAANGGRQAMAAALHQELAQIKDRNGSSPKALSEVYGNAAAMFNYLQMPDDSLEMSRLELEQLIAAGEPAVNVAGAHRTLALGYYRADRYEQALQELARGLSAVPHSADEDTRIVRARLWRATSMYQLALNRLQPARQAAEAARGELAPDLRARHQYYGAATLELARVLDELGDDERPLALLEEVQAIYAGLPGLAESEWGGMEWTRAWVLASLGRHSESALAWQKAAALYGKQFGLTGPNAASVDAYLAAAWIKTGQYGSAQSKLESAVAILERAPEGSGRAILQRARQTQLELTLERGDLEGAATALEGVKALGPGLLPNLQLRQLAAQARLASARGAHAQALATVRDAEQLLQHTAPDGLRTMRLLELLAAELELAAGHANAARARLEMIPAPTADAIDYNVLLAADLRAAADLAEGRIGAAQGWYASAPARLAGDLDSHRGPRDEALARIAWGRALDASGQTATARRQFDRAAVLLAGQHPASPLLAQLHATSR